MRATLDDFTSKYGFHDGEAVEARDFTIRRKFLEQFNEVAKGHYVAVDWDRAGMHNSCLIVFFDHDQWCEKPDDYLEKWLCGKLTPADPQVVAGKYPVDQMIEDLYRDADEE